MEVDLDGDDEPDIAGPATGPFSVSLALAVGPHSIRIRPIEHDQSTGTTLSGTWQAVAIGILAPTTITLTDVGSCQEPLDSAEFLLTVDGRVPAGSMVIVNLVDLAFADGSTSRTIPLGLGLNSPIPINVRSPNGGAIGGIQASLDDPSGAEIHSQFLASDTMTGSFWTAIAKGQVDKAISILEIAVSQGVLVASRHGTSAAVGALGAVYSKYPASALHCQKASQLASRALTAVGENPFVMRLRDGNNARCFFLEDGATKFAETGNHQFVQVGNRCDCAITGPAGMTMSDYVAKMRSLGNDATALRTWERAERRGSSDRYPGKFQRNKSDDGRLRPSGRPKISPSKKNRPGYILGVHRRK